MYEYELMPFYFFGIMAFVSSSPSPLLPVHFLLYTLMTFAKAASANPISVAKDFGFALLIGFIC